MTFPDTSVEQATSKENGQANEAATTSNGGKYGTAGKGLKAITLIPCNAPETGGRFRVWLYKGVAEEDEEVSRIERQSYENGQVVLLWDRKIKGGFPELKELVSLLARECNIVSLTLSTS